MVGSPLTLKRRVGRPGVRATLVRLARPQALVVRPRPEQLHCFRQTPKVRLDDSLEAFDLALLPTFQGAGLEPSYPQQHVDETHVLLDGERLFRSPDDTFANRPLLPCHERTIA